MNVDCFMVTGTTHDVCEDYTVCSLLHKRDDGLSYDAVFVADGCSSSPMTDIGSRVICKVAQRVWKTSGEGRWDDALNVLYSSRAIGRTLELPEQSFDSTLMIASGCESDGICHIHVLGDGVIALRSGDCIVLIEIEYDDSAPLYLNYFASVPRIQAYGEKYGQYRIKWNYYDEHGCPILADVGFQGVCREFGPATHLYFEIDRKYYDLALIMSDGVSHFTRLEETETDKVKKLVQTIDVVKEVMRIKGFRGEFIKRRAKRFMRDALKRGWQNEDDFSIGAIYLGEK